MSNLPSFAKKIAIGKEAREKILRGVNTLADCVSATLGPGGRNCIVVRPMEQTTPFSTRDGVTVAREVYLTDEFEDAGAQLLKSVAKKACDETGDGTTTSVVLARAILNAGVKAIGEGAAPVHLKRGIEQATLFASKHLEDHASAVHHDDLSRIATISANGDSFIGNMVAEALAKVGADGIVALEKSPEATTRLEFVDGCQVEGGWVSPHFVTNNYTQECELNLPFILLLDKKLSAFRELIPLFEQIYKEGRAILVIAESVEGEAIATLVKNHINPGVQMQVCAIKAPGHAFTRRELLDDIAALTGATVISTDMGMKLSSITLDHLGQCGRAVIGQFVSRIILGGGDSDRLETRVKELRANVEKEPEQAIKERLQARLAGLSGGVACILCGGATEIEAEERKYRIEDSLHATRCALEKGIVPGGGIALLKASQALSAADLGEENKAYKQGWGIVAESLLVPFQRISSNAGYDPDESLQRALASVGDFGLNALTGKWGNLREMGVIDPLKVVTVALKTASSVAGLVLLTESLIVHPVGGLPPALP